MKILLVGRHGQLAWELQRSLSALGDVVVAGSAEMNLADPDAIAPVVQAVRPALIVNAAAYTAVDKAEGERARAMAVNGLAPGLLAEQARELGAALLHFSSDYVFDGGKDTPYTEQDVPRPLNVYGESKLAGERAIQQVGCAHLVLRTSWLYGARGHNFLLSMLRLLRTRAEVGVVDDQQGAPCWSRWLAEAVALALARRDPREWPTRDGIFHLAPAGATSWYGMACAIRELMACPGRATPIPAAAYSAPARRPQNSRLSCARAEAEFGLYRPDWRELLELCLADLRG